MTGEKDKNCRVAIFDDEEARAQDWLTKLQAMGIAGLDFEVPEKEKIESQLDALFKRRQLADEKKSIESVICDLDNVDVLVVDYDLRHFGEHRGFATGEEIAYSARLFSKVKIIVVVNHPSVGLNDFDLTMQRDRDLKGDIYVGDAQICNPALWQADPGHDGFCPWSWPIIPEDVENYNVCLKSVSENCSDELLAFFGLTLKKIEIKPSALTFLASPLGETFFNDVLQFEQPEYFVRPKDLAGLEGDADRRNRVLIAAIKIWLRKWVLPSQTFIADAVHLAVALPWSLRDYKNVENWHALTNRDLRNSDVLAKTFRREVLSFAMTGQEWFSAPVFFLQSVREKLEEAGEPTKNFDFSAIPDYLFAEDISRFLETKFCIDYTLRIYGQSQARAISDFENLKFNTTEFSPVHISYGPQRLLM